MDRDVQAEKKQRAAALRDRLGARGTLVVNLVSSPGAGKTALLQELARRWQGTRKIAVLVGDLATERDADRLRPFVPVEQLTTGGACHLEVPLVESGLQKLPQDDYEFLFIENVGNLVCPASHDLGEHVRIVLLSTTEGDDKPGKYPKLFRTSQVMVITKCDLLPHVPFSVPAARADALNVQPELTVLETSALTGQGIHEWCSCLDRLRTQLLSSPLTSRESASE